MQDYLDAHPAKFEIAAEVAFEQIFLNPAQRGEAIDAEATAIKAKLQADPALEPAMFGDASLLPSDMQMTDIFSIGDTFGPEFAAAVGAAPAGRWIGPVPSSFGLHLIRVSEHRPGRLAALGDVRDLVLREFANERRKAIEEERLNAAGWFKNNFRFVVRKGCEARRRVHIHAEPHQVTEGGDHSSLLRDSRLLYSSQICCATASVIAKIRLREAAKCQLSPSVGP